MLEDPHKVLIHGNRRKRSRTSHISRFSIFNPYRRNQSDLNLQHRLTLTNKNGLETGKKHCNTKKKTGMDEIHSIFLQKGQQVLIPHLFKIFRGCLASGSISTQWQKARVIYLPKVGRISNQTPKLYRTISLSSFLLKTLGNLLDI